MSQEMVKYCCICFPFFRLISERTVEENILKKANQKRMLGDMAIEGGNFTTAFFKEVLFSHSHKKIHNKQETNETNMWACWIIVLCTSC